MSLKLAELFITLSDTYQKIADEMLEGIVPPEVTAEAPTAEAEAVAEEAEEKRQAAEKKKAAAAKRRAAAKAKKEAEAKAAEEAEPEVEEEPEEKLSPLKAAQKLAGEYMHATSIKDARGVLLNFNVRKVSEAEGDDEKLADIAEAFRVALGEL